MRAEAGVQIIDVDEPSLRPGHVKLRIEKGSICGTDLHIFNWDAWSASRIHPPRIIGHEFCGTVVEVASDISTHAVGDFVASESHIVCGTCRQCLSGQGHVCVNTSLLGVDVDGGWAKFAVIPAENARKIPSVVPKNAASLLDALGNAVHTVMAGPIEGQDVLITGLGPIGLFSVAICKALRARTIIGTEISEFRKNIASELGCDLILDPTKDDISTVLAAKFPTGVDATLEMSGHPSSIGLALNHTRPGGRVSLLGLFANPVLELDMNQLIFKGLNVQGIIGRQLPHTWDQMTWLLTEKKLDISAVITHELDYSDVLQAMELLKTGGAGKVVMDFSNA